MRNKYDYFVNNKKVKRKDFVRELESCCQKIMYIDTTGGWCSIDLIEFDEKKFRQNMRDIERGITVMFPERNKTFNRKVVV